MYKNTDGVTTTIRLHLKQRHSEEYEKVVSLLKLKHSDDLDHPSVRTAPSHQGPFELDEWVRLMIRWIITDDQVCFGIISAGPELTDFLLFYRLSMLSRARSFESLFCTGAKMLRSVIYHIVQSLLSSSSKPMKRSTENCLTVSR